MYLFPFHSSTSSTDDFLLFCDARFPSVLSSSTINTGFLTLPGVTCPQYCNFSFATFAISSLSGANSDSSSLIYSYDVLAGKLRVSSTNTTFQKLQLCFLKLDLDKSRKRSAHRRGIEHTGGGSGRRHWSTNATRRLL